MKVIGTVFEDVNKKKFNKIWKDTELFKFLNENEDEVKETLANNNIQRVVAFDQISDNWVDWRANDRLTLAILPVCNIVDQDGRETTKYILDNYGIKLKKEHLPIDIHTQEFVINTSFVYYFKTRNLIVTTVNPFLEKEVYKLFKDILANMEIKYLDEDALMYLNLENQWKITFELRERQLESGLANLKDSIENYKRHYFDYTQKYNESMEKIQDIKRSKTNIKGRIQKEFDDVRKIPVVKDLIIRDKIYFNFGNIFLTGKVKTGTRENDDGIVVPIMEIRKIEIGVVKFIIGDGKVIVENDKSVRGYQHPHASDGGLCYGEADLKVSEMIANLDIAKLIKFLYSWVFSYNEGDAYCTLQEFYNQRELERKETLKKKEELKKGDE